jgi:hypothetical protein
VEEEAVAETVGRMLALHQSPSGRPRFPDAKEVLTTIHEVAQEFGRTAR